MIKQSFSSYFRDERRQCAEAFCMQRALAPEHDCYVADKQHLNQSVTVTEDNKICTETPERSYQLGTTKLLKQVLPHVILTPVRSKVSTPRGLMFDNDTESKDAWSVSMATPQSEQQVDSVELVDTVTSSTSGDESCSGLSNVEYSSSFRAGSNDVKGEVISQRVVVKQETEDEHCHRTPLTLVARKLFTKCEPNTFATSHSAPSSPDLILSPQDAADNSQDTIKSKDAPVSQSSPTCSEDMFDSAHSDITLSHVMSSTPVIERRKDDGLVTINTREVMAVADELVDDNCDHVENSDTSSHKLNTEVHAHAGDINLSDSPDSKPDTTNEKCKADTSCSKDVIYDNSDLMDELFANHFTNLTQLATEQLLEKEHKLIHSNQIANQTDSGCGDDEIHNDVMDHVISKNESVSPIPTANGFHHFTVANTAKPLSSSDKVPLRKSSKPFKAPRMAKEVGEDEKNKLMEEYCKKFPSLNDNKRTSCDNGGASSTDTVIPCGFTSAGSGKKFTVSAAALQRAVRLVEDCTNDLFTEQHDTGSHGNTAVNEMLCHVEEDTKMVDTEKSLNQMSIPKGGEEAKETLLSKEEVGESSECGKEERSHDITKGSHELVDNYGLDNIDMEQFSVFTQMPGYMRAGRSTDDMVDDDYQLSTATVQQISDEIWTPAGQPSSVTPVQKEHVSSYITPGGSFNPCPSGRSVYNNNTTPCRQSAGDDELKKMFSTQVVKQFLDFNSSNEDNDDTTVKVTENENSASPAHNDKILPCVTSCDTDNHIHKTCSVTENNCTHTGSPDDTSSPAHHDSKPPTSLPKSAVFGGFSTASGKSVTISDDAISKVKQLLDDACGDTISGRALRDHQCIGDDVCGHSPSTVQQLFTDDKMADGDSVVTGNHTADDKSSNNTDIAVDDSHNKVISLIEPSHNAAVVLSAHGSCDPSPDTTVVMEATPVNKINYTKRITSSMKRRRRDPLFTTPEAVLSDRAHPKRMCFTPMITNSNSVTRSTDDVAMATSKQAPKFMTPFKAHRMSSTPQHKSVVTPVQPVWRGSWKKLGMSTTTVPFHYFSSSNSNNNKSVNDSGIGSSLPDHPTTPAPATSATGVEEQEGIDKQFEVTDTQMESFFATQGSVSPILNHRDCGGVVRPQSGTLSMMRSTSAQRVSITSLTGCVRPGRYSRHQLISLGVHPAVLDVTAATAVNFQFDVHHYFSQSVLQKKTVTIGDGVVLKLEPHSDHVTMEQLNKVFLCSPGVDGELISSEWFANHYRWIVWKLASLEVSFPHSFAGRWLTPHWLLLHMKYRYDREIDLAHRSCIKKILERDDNPTKTMVLVITEICSFDDNAIDNEDDIKDTSRPTVKMSDGWYSVGVVMDTPLKYVLNTNQITVGCKLYISGAKLLGSCDPCPPLECPDSVMLKINANSTRRAHWNAKLGFQPCPAPFPVPMSSLFADGGLVGCVHVTIVRTYPLLHMERTSDGNCVFRNQRKEEMVAKEYDTRRQQCLEDISLQVREEFEKELNQKNRRQCYRRRRSISHAQISKLTDGQKIDEALSNVPDPVEFEQHLTVTQKALLDSYRHGVLEQQRRELEQRIEMAIKESEDKLPPLRNVVPLLKVRVVGHPSRLTEWTDNSEFQSCILTVWRPTDDVVCLLQEGVSVKLYHVMASSPHRHSSDYIQLATNRGTRFERLSKVNDDLLQLLYQPRKVTPLAQLASSNHSVDYGQVDITGIIITVLSSNITTANGKEKLVDKVYITDEHDNIIVVKVWDGVESMITKDCVSAGRVVCFINLSYKSWLDDDGIPTCSTNDQSIFTVKPQYVYLKPAFRNLEKFIKSNLTVLKNLEERIAHLH